VEKQKANVSYPDPAMQEEKRPKVYRDFFE